MSGSFSRIALGLLISAAVAESAGVRAQNPPPPPPAPAAAAATSPAASGTPDTLFADASAKEAAVRKALAASSPQATILKAVRTVIADYENVVRRYPASGYCDDALWRAAMLSRDAFAQFGDAHEQSAGIRLLQRVQTGYPTSKFARQAPAEISLLRAATPAAAPVLAPAPPPAAVAAPVQPTPAAPAATSTTPGTTGTPGPPAVAAAQGSASVPASKVATIKDIRRAVMGDTVRIIIELDQEVSFHDDRLESPARVFVDLPATRTIDRLKDQTIRFDGDTDLVRQVRIGRHPNETTRVVLEAAGISSYSVYPLYSPYRLIIDCLRANAAAPQITETAAPAVRPAAPPAVAAVRPVTAAPAPVPTPAPLSAPLSAPPAAPAPAPARTPPVVSTTGRAPAPPLLVALRFSTSLQSYPFAVPIATAAIAEAFSDAVTPLPAARVAPVATSAPPAPPAGAASRNLTGGLSIARQLGLGVSRIVIDPGHGGHDPGTKGGGSNEADMVLDVALRLEKLIQKASGMDVVLTRRDDSYVSLQERTAIANREGADLFLSIHANANSSAEVHGIETYFLNFASNLGAAAVAARENAASGQSMGELPDVVKTIALNNKLDESRDFATLVQREMVSRLRPANKDLKDLGVKQAPFVVLIGAAMPSILAEISFMTNSQDARLLKSPAYRQRIAEALFEGVRKYQSTLGPASATAQRSQP